MQPSFEPDEAGYLATFRGSLTVDQLEVIHARAIDAFGDGTLRWAVFDMSEAWVEPAASPDMEQRQMENVHRMAEHVRNAVTPDLRLAVVARDDITLTLLRLTAAAVELPTPSATDSGVRSIAHFADVPSATAWARAGDS